MNWNLVRSIYVRSSIKIVHFVSIRLQTWPPQKILVSDCLISKKSSPLKLHGQMNRNLLGSIYGRSSIKSAHFVLILFLIGWVLTKSSPLKPLCQMNWNLVGSIYGRSSIKIAHFVPIRSQTWPPQEILVSDWLISKKSSLKPGSQMNSNLVGSTYGKFCIKFPQIRMKGEQHRLIPLSL
jgi:hypothetical protein